MSNRMKRTDCRMLLTALLTINALSFQDARAQTGPPHEALTFGRVFMGDLGNGETASTVILLTNRDAVRTTCRALVLLNRAPSQGQTEVFFNGQAVPGDTVEVDIPRGGVRKIRLTSAGGLVAGAVLIAPFEPCTQDSVAGNGRFEIKTGDGGIKEVYSIAPNGPQEWLKNNRCVAIPTCFMKSPADGGFGNNLGVAFTGVSPGLMAPADTSILARTFDAEGNPVDSAKTFPFNGAHQAFFPLDSFQGLSDGLLTLVLCLFTSDAIFQADVTPIQVGTDTQGGTQFDAPSLADRFDSGQNPAWDSNLKTKGGGQ